MKRSTMSGRLLVGLSGLSLLLAACGGGESVTSNAGSNGGSDQAAGADCGFSEELVSAAQEEGAVTIYAGGHTREGLETLTQGFEKAYGIEVTGVREDSGSVVRMLQAELAAGNLNADVVSLASAPAMEALNEAGALTESEAPNLDSILDGVDDPSTPQIPYAVTPLGLMYNESSNDSPPQTWQELAAYDGKIVIADPGSSGTSLSFFSMLYEELGEEWLVELAEGGNTIVTDSSLALAQLVLTGEADIGIPAIESAVVAAAEGGEPLALVMPDPLPTFSAELAVLADAPHPNAAKLLTQYHLCQDFQEAISAQGGRTALTDGPDPQGVQELGDAELLTSDTKSVEATREELLATFNRLFK